MKLSSRIKPLSYITANAADVLRGLADDAEPLLTLLSLGEREIAAGETKEASAVFADLAIELTPTFTGPPRFSEERRPEPQDPDHS